MGPGHGIQLKSGRLLIPAYAYHIECKECFGQLCQTSPHAFCFYSDDHGRTWRFGEAVPGPESVECQMVSVDEEDGTNVLYVNARSVLGHRVQALSFDDGATFQEGQLVQRLVEAHNGCHGSVVGFPAPLRSLGRQPKHGCRHWTSSLDHRHLPSANPSLHRSTTPDFLTPTWVVYSHPTWTNARKDLGVSLSVFPRDPDSWRGPWVIYEGPSAYSDLAYVELPAASPGSPPAVAFACLFECGAKTAYDEICFCIFTLYELIDNLPQLHVQQESSDRARRQKQSGGSGREPGSSSRSRGDGSEQTLRSVKTRKKSKLAEICALS